MKKSYVMNHVIKYNMDPNMDLNYSRKIGPEIQKVENIEGLSKCHSINSTYAQVFKAR